MLLILDNKSEFIKVFEEFLHKYSIPFVVKQHDEKLTPALLKDVGGLILSGGSIGLKNPNELQADYLALKMFNVPTIGFCLGHEVIAVANGGAVEKLPHREMTMEEIIIDDVDDPIFENLPNKIFLKEKHYNHISKLPKNFRVIAHSDICPVEVMRHKNKLIYGFQSHPELVGEHGKNIIKNFLQMCGFNIK